MIFPNQLTRLARKEVRCSQTLKLQTAPINHIKDNTAVIIKVLLIGAPTNEVIVTSNAAEGK